MRLNWQTTEDYAEAIVNGLHAALAQTPRDHLRQLSDIIAYDTDPLGARLGVYIRDRSGTRIELYLQPHLELIGRDRRLQRLEVAEYSRAIVLQLAHTLYHEIGHHLTLTLNPRKKPSRKRPAVSDTLETWAEQYAAKRLEKFSQSRS